MACAKPEPGFAPPTTATGLPELAPFTKNCTDPVGSCDAFAVALLCVDTVAVNVTGVPDDTVEALAPTVTKVAAFVMVITPVAGPLALKLLSPEYVAAIVCVPAGNWMF